MELLKSKKQFPSVFSDFWNKDHFYNDRFFRPSWWSMETVKELAMKVKQEKGQYVLEPAIPRLKKEDVDTHIEDGFLIVQSKLPFLKNDVPDSQKFKIEVK